MPRPHQTVSTRQLLDLARSPSASISALQDIVFELHKRKNRYAIRALIEVGKLLERAQEEEHRQRRDQQRAERERQLQLRQEGFFEWPSTDAPASIYGFSGDQFFYQDGLLSYVGYRVGRNSRPLHIRRQILDCVFHNELPNVVSTEYMIEWGLPRTPARLRKLAESVAAFTRNAKRNTGYDYIDAIADWESDLEYLRNKYYDDEFGFVWPPLA
jgi:hypothetical protein